MQGKQTKCLLVVAMSHRMRQNCIPVWEICSSVISINFQSFGVHVLSRGCMPTIYSICTIVRVHATTQRSSGCAAPPSLHLNILTHLLCHSFAHFAGCMVCFYCFLLYLFSFRCFLAHPADPSTLDSVLHLWPTHVSSCMRQDDIISHKEDKDELHTVTMCRSYPSSVKVARRP